MRRLCGQTIELSERDTTLAVWTIHADRCTQRRGEALELFMDDDPTYSYLPPVYYYQGRDREGLKSPDFAGFYGTYLTIRGQSTDDPLLADIHQRLKQ